MNFTPRTEAEVQSSRAKFAPFPQGTYEFEIIEAVDEVSKKGNDMLHLTLKCYHPTETWTRFVHDYIVASLEHKLRHFAYAVGLGVKYEAGSLNAQDCLGRTGKAKLKVKTDVGYEPKNEVDDYLVPEGYQEQKQAVGTAVAHQGVGVRKPVHDPIPDDQIPF